MSNAFSFIKKSNSPVADATVFCAVVVLTGLVFSPFLLSIGLWLFVFTALWQSALEVRSRSGNGLKTSGLAFAVAILKNGFIRFFQKKELLALSLLLLVPAASGLWSDDLGYWLTRTRVRIPFFVMAWVFANLPLLDERRAKIPLYFLTILLALTCVGVGLNYSLHFQEIMRGMGEGRPIPVPRNHIRFNLILVTGVFCGGWLAATRFYLFRVWETRVLWALTAFLFVFVHVLSVRSGLLALYVGLFFTLVWFVFKTKKWLAGLALLLALLALPLLAVKLAPSLALKIEYMKWDWLQVREQGGGQYSDSGRMVSLLGGWELAKTQPLLGVGTGDLPREMERFSATYFPQYQEDVKLPHNQFLYILAATGGLGLALSLLALYLPLAVRRHRRFYLFGVFQCLALASFLVEYTLETAIGAGFFLFFQLWFLKISEEMKVSVSL